MAILVSGIDLLRELGFYQVIFPLILITAATFGVLTKLGIFGESRGLNLIISMMLGLIIISFAPAVKVLTFTLVYAMMLFSVVMFLVLIFMFMGLKMEDIANAAKTSEVYVAIFAVTIIFLIIVLSQALPEFGDATRDVQSGTVEFTNQLPYTDGNLQQGQLLQPSGSPYASSSTVQRGISTLYDPSVLSVIIMLLVFAGATLLIQRTPKSRS